jgi:hypothetical protein
MPKKPAASRSLREAYDKVGRDAADEIAKWPAWMREPPRVPLSPADNLRPNDTRLGEASPTHKSPT